MSSELPDGWASQPLSSTAKIAMGETLLSKDLTGTGVPVFSANTDSGPWGHTDQNRRTLKRGSIVVGARGSIGFPRLPAYDTFTSTQTTITVEPDASVVDSTYLHAVLCAADIRSLAAQQAVPMLTIGMLAPLPILLPPLDEQRRIAEVLRSVDEALTGASVALSQTVEARAHQLERIMALPGDMRPLAEVCRLGGGSGFPIKHQGKQKGTYPFAKVSDMNRLGNETELKTAENYVDDADLKVLRAKTFPPGTTFFPKVGATLLTNKRRIAVRETVVDNNIMAAVPTDIDQWFLFYAFSTIDMADYVQAGAVPSINQGTVGKIMIPVPSREVQTRYVETMRDLDQAIQAQRAAITTLIGTKTAVSADLLSGRVRVPA